MCQAAAVQVQGGRGPPLDGPSLEAELKAEVHLALLQAEQVLFSCIYLLFSQTLFLVAISL